MYDRDMHAHILSSGPYCMSLTRYLIIRTLAKTINTRAKQDHRTCSRHSRKKKKEKRKKMDNRTCLPRVELINAWRSGFGGYFYARGTRAIPTPCACPAMLVYATCDDLGKQLFSVSVPCSIIDKD